MTFYPTWDHLAAALDDPDENIAKMAQEALDDLQALEEARLAD